MNNKYTQLILYAVHFTYGLHNMKTKKDLTLSFFCPWIYRLHSILCETTRFTTVSKMTGIVKCMDRDIFLIGGI
jgi:hypothetical protein